ncbi:MAG: maleylpyruvate isomerase family mycothiol-dependent enzyme [Cryobacterium sp.]
MELHADSLLPGWTRAHVAAHVGYNAWALARLVGWARTDVETPMYASGAERNHEITRGADLAPNALRALGDASSADLDEAWRDLPADAWAYPVRTMQGATVAVSQTVWMRTRELFLHTVDLAAGPTVQDIPAAVLQRLLGDITNTWAARGDDVGLLLRDTDTGAVLGDTGHDDPHTVSGTLAALAGWASGRSSTGVRSNRAGLGAALVVNGALRRRGDNGAAQPR